jgi:enoyl-[acyl-carrier-protein] reductase (NADH)
LANCPRSLIFGGSATVEQYRGNPRVQAHGPGFSKILLGDDQVDNWPKYLDLMVDSVLVNSGRGCINCSGVWVSRHARAIAEALAEVGADVAAVDVAAPNETLAAVEALGRGGLALEADVRSRADVERAVSDTVCQLGRLDILVNAVCPGPIESEMTRGYDYNVTVQPIARMGQPRDVAQVVVFLASQMSNFVTGQTLNVDGGMLMD